MERANLRRLSGAGAATQSTGSNVRLEAGVEDSAQRSVEPVARVSHVADGCCFTPARWCRPSGRGGAAPPFCAPSSPSTRPWPRRALIRGVAVQVGFPDLTSSKPHLRLLHRHRQGDLPRRPPLTTATPPTLLRGGAPDHKSVRPAPMPSAGLCSPASSQHGARRRLPPMPSDYLLVAYSFRFAR
ncbi:hypothetical protein QYE76_000633 [Lolium multiflorum]|uniref:Uncharacterized protein n=1 Tax=Lolium multiflorum TaxID=4521 RepID=A0AAD8RJJ8_LOLMU|nr:hypothetical protein QYE76_000633 [Lolium multiflorum]